MKRKAERDQKRETPIGANGGARRMQKPPKHKKATLCPHFGTHDMASLHLTFTNKIINVLMS